MPNIDQAVDFLVRNNALELGESPWPTREDDQDVYEIDWDKLFPPRSRDIVTENAFPFGDHLETSPTDEEIGQLKNLLGVGAPRVDSPAPNQEPNWDMCAWYQPIHFFGHDWGIFIKEDCARRTALMIARFVDPSVVRLTHPTVWFKALFRSATYLYFLHEHYHHKIECLGFRLHVVQQKSAFLPYHKLVYAVTKGTDDQLEEALANADCYHRISTQPYAFWLTAHLVKATRAYLRWQYPKDPPGYRMAAHYLNHAAFDAGENVLQAQVKEATLKPSQPTDEWELAPRMTQSFFPITANIWTVVPAGAKSRLPLKRVVPLRTCSTYEMVSLYEEAGYSEVNGGKGSHVKLKKPGAPTMILPGNRSELSPRVAKTALRVLGDFNLHDLPDLVKSGLSDSNAGKRSHRSPKPPRK